MPEHTTQQRSRAQEPSYHPKGRFYGTTTTKVRANGSLHFLAEELYSGLQDNYTPHEIARPQRYRSNDNLAVGTWPGLRRNKVSSREHCTRMHRLLSACLVSASARSRTQDHQESKSVPRRTGHWTSACWPPTRRSFLFPCSEGILKGWARPSTCAKRGRSRLAGFDSC